MPTDIGGRCLVVDTGSMLDELRLTFLQQQAYGQVRRTIFRGGEALWREIIQFRPHVVVLYSSVPVDMADLVRRLASHVDFWPCRFLSLSPVDNTAVIYKRSGQQTVTFATSGAFLALVDGRRPLAGPGTARTRAQMAGVS